MGRWRRLQNWVTGQAPQARPAEEDPEVLLKRASDEMRAMHARNRERAVQAITQKNNLQHMVDETARRVAKLDAKIEEASQAGDEPLMLKIMREKQSYEQTLAVTRVSLAKAVETTEQVKLAILREDEKIRMKTAEALALKTQWRLVKVEEALTISLAQLSAGNYGLTTRNQVRQRHQRNRELVVEAITQKNTLESLVSKARDQAGLARERADAARREGDEVAERELLREMEQHEASLASTDAALQQSIHLSERARVLFTEEAAHFKRLNLVDEPADINSAQLAEDDTSTTPDIARYRMSLRRVLALAVLFAVVAIILSFFFE